MKSVFYALFFLSFMLIHTGCQKNNDDKPAGQWDNTVFIVNEGPFQTGNGSISAYQRETGEISHNLFEATNGRPLGNIVQSMAIYQDKAFIVVNNAGRIEVVDLAGFKSIATIDQLTMPRYFLAVSDDKACVSCWDNTVKVISMDNYSVTGQVETGEGPDEMVSAGGRVFVINTGGFGLDSTVTFFSIDDEEDFGRITAGHRPAGIVTDFAGKVWVLCAGKGWNGFPAAGDTPGRLLCFDPSTLEILKEFTFPDAENHPEGLVGSSDGMTLFYTHPAGVFKFPVNSTALPAEPLITGSTMFYGIGVDPENDMILLSDPLDYAQNGWIFRYHSADGSAVDSFRAGLIPNGFCFN